MMLMESKEWRDLYGVHSRGCFQMSTTMNFFCHNGEKKVFFFLKLQLTWVFTYIYYI